MNTMALMSGILLSADASTDLFSNEWTVGNLFEIQGLVNILGHVAVVVISAVGFGIVIFSILKNAISGLYVVNPPFWDRVDELKKDAVEGTQGLIQDTIGKSNNIAAKKLGGALTTLLGFIPNIKALTDFDDSDGEVVDKKQYFVKSIPLLVAQIFIGTLIFMGYPTKIASWVGQGGTYAIDAVLNNVDPVTTVQKISDGIVVYSLASDNSQDPYEQNVNAFTKQILKVVQSKYTDMKKESTQNTALIIEQIVDEAFSGDETRDVLGVDEGYNITSSAIYQTVSPEHSSSFKQLKENLFVSQANNGAITYRFFVNGTDLQTGSTMESSGDWFVLSVNATPEAVTNSSSASLIAFGGISSKATIENAKDGSRIKLPITGLTFGSGANESEVRGTLGKTLNVDVVEISSGEIKETFQVSMQSAAVGVTSGATASLYFNAGDKERLQECLTSGNYFKVNLVGDWSKDVKDGTTTTTLRVQELRLIPGSSDVSYALTTWTDVDMKTDKGATGLGSAFLKKTTLNGEASPVSGGNE